MSNPYRTLFVGELVQKSALSIGGNRPHEAVDAPLCRDGLGRVTLRGTALAGALVSTARKRYSDEWMECISRDPAPGRGGEAGPDSLWMVHNSHPEGDARPEFRQGVGIRHDTGAAATGALYDVEVMPRGTRWPLVLEVVTHRPGGIEAEGIAAHVLSEWLRGYGWIGANVARGMGWLRLEALRVYRLMMDQEDHVRAWPDSRYASILEAVEALPVEPERLTEPGNLESSFEIPGFDKTWYYSEITGRIGLGTRKDGYGLDAISIGGHGSAALDLCWDDRHFLAPKGLPKGGLAGEFEPDQAFVMSRDALTGKVEPVLPGSSLRGPLRHTLSRHLRTCHPEERDTVRDPVVDPTPPKDPGPCSRLLEVLFGSTERSARLMVCDAHLSDPDDWHAAWLQQHAEDEFSAGTFGSGKFDRMVLLGGEFRWRMVIEGPDEGEVRDQRGLLQHALNYAQEGQLGIGGQQWRGLGWPRWTVDTEVTSVPHESEE